MMANGERIRSTVWGNSSTSIRPSTMESGRTISGKVMVPTITLTEIDMKVNGTVTCKMEQALTTTPMEISIRENG